MKPDWTRLPLLALVIVLLLSGALTYIEEGEGSGAAALIAGGLVALGALVAVEVTAAHQRMHRDDGDGNATKGPDEGEE